MAHVEAGGNRLVSLAAAIIAVLAALGTLYAHHASIAALSAKNQAILTQGRATDTYNAYEAKQIRYNIYSALLASNLVRDSENRKRLESIAEGERASTPAVLQKAKGLEQEAVRDDERSGRILRSYETLQFATTFFEISIVLVAISALTRTRIFLPLGCALSGVGLVLLAVGFIQSR
ncbi:MAG TPA: DUF4337 family protein [Candidatus Babeliales bacterium]|nr:DUF4337 family protein [Candidatus Babeliales bacterium]